MVTLGDRPLLAFTTSLLLPLLLASAPLSAWDGQTGTSSGIAGTQWAQLTIEQRVIVRIPTVRGAQRSGSLRDGAGLPSDDSLKEVKGPKCLQLNRLRGAAISPEKGITMIMVPSAQFRAHFSRSCRPADFYAGFYIEPNKDGSLCAGRDMLHARSGSTCEIVKFSRLVPSETGDAEK